MAEVGPLSIFYIAVMLKSIYFTGVFTNYIIGAGMFALPYIALKVGIFSMFAYILILGAFIVFINLLYGDLALRTPDYKRLPGFAKFYLGNVGEKIAFISTTLGTFGALLVYLILGGEFFKNIFAPIFGGGNLIYTLLIFSLGAIFIFFDRKVVFLAEFLCVTLFMIILFVIFWRGLPFFRFENLFIKTGAISDLFLPYGPVLFSLWGLELIPDIEEALGSKKSLIKKIIIFGTLIPILVYLFFVVIILGISGSQTADSALPGLSGYLGSIVISLAFFLGVITNLTSFNSVGLTLKDVFRYDFKINKNLSWAITCFFPLFLFLIGFKSFILVISLVGGAMLAINGILVLLMYYKVTKKKFIFPINLILILGIIYEIIYFIK